MSAELVSLTEAARRLEYSRSALSELLQRERISTRRRGTARLVSWPVLVELVAERIVAVSLATLATRLGVTRQRLTRHLRRTGKLPPDLRRGRSVAFAPEDAAHIARFWRRHAS